MITIIAILAAMLLPALNSARKTAKMAQCTSNSKMFTQLNQMYASTYNNFVTPIRWGTPTIWPALLWNIAGNGASMPLTGSPKSKEDWVEQVKASNIFFCPGDEGAKANPDGDKYLPKISYAMNRQVTKKSNATDDAAVGVVFKVTRFRFPAQMIFASDTAMSGKNADKDYGYLYCQKNVKGYKFRPGSIVHPWDQQALCVSSDPSSNNSINDAANSYQPWHVGQTWNYAFIDGHVNNYHPADTLKSAKGEKRVMDRTPYGFWTWNQNDWGNSTADDNDY